MKYYSGTCINIKFMINRIYQKLDASIKRNLIMNRKHTINLTLQIDTVHGTIQCVTAILEIQLDLTTECKMTCMTS